MTAGPPSDGAPFPAGPAGPHPVYLFAGVPDGASTAAELRVPSDVPDDLVWADDRLDAVGDSVHLMRQMGADPAVLSTLTGFAGLERLLVWGKARATSGFVPAGVRIGVSVDRQLSWLRRVQGPEQFADILDLISPRVDRHRSMPDVFGDRSRRAKLMESLWAWGRSWQRFVEAGGVRLRAEADLDDRVAAAATWIGVVVETGAAVERPALKLAHLGRDDDGAPRFRVRVRAPLVLADATGDPVDSIAVNAGESMLVITVGGWSRRFGAPAVLSVCAIDSVEAEAPGTWADGWGDILIGFRADPAKLPEHN